MAQEGLADGPPSPQRMLFVTLCVGTGLAQAPWLGYDRLATLRCSAFLVNIYLKNTSFL